MIASLRMGSLGIWNDFHGMFGVEYGKKVLRDGCHLGRIWFP